MMDWFWKKKSRVPAWADFFSEAEYAAFLDAVAGYFKSLGLACEIDDGMVQLPENEYGFGRLGLDNLARFCKQNDSRDYASIVREHFDGMIEDSRFRREFETVKTDFGQIRKYIAVRLYDEAYMACLGKEYFIGKAFAGELFAAVVYDFPHTIVNVRPEDAQPWGKSVDELLGIGLANVRDNYATPPEAVEFGEEKDCFFVVETPHFFAPNILFELETRPRLLGKGGALAAAPCRNAALVYPIKDMRVLDAIHILVATTARMHENNPGALTREIYWYRRGVFTPIPYKIAEKSIKIAPPQEFVDLLDLLAKKNDVEISTESRGCG
jgi:hypothetical protein